jgi:hypothetical protein
MFWTILEFCPGLNNVDQTTSHPVPMPDFPVHHSPGNWRPIIRETDSDSSSVSSSSENVSPKGAKFEEDPRTYSCACRIVSQTFRDNDAKWSNTLLDRELFVKVKDIPGWCRNHGKGGIYAHDTIRPAILEKILTQCQGLSAASQKLGKTAYLCDSYVCLIFVTHFPVFRPFCLNARGEFKNPSLKAIADLFIGIMIAHGCDPDVAKNLVYSSVAGVDLLPVMVLTIGQVRKPLILLRTTMTLPCH